MLLMPLAVAPVAIRHRRYLPTSNVFEARLSYLWFDPDQIQAMAQQSYLWSTNRWNVLRVDAKDFLTTEPTGQPKQASIRDKIHAIIAQQVGVVLAADAPIRVLALPRTLGFCFNSVVFYMVFDTIEQPLFILSEISNTPWNERKVYVHDCRGQSVQHGVYQGFQFDFKKSFHVSPFMPMNMEYCWRFNFSAQQQVIHMQLFQEDILQFDATMRFSLQCITLPSQQHRYAVSCAFEPFKMLSAIYWQAFRLWRKKVPFYRHPKKSKGKSL